MLLTTYAMQYKLTAWKLKVVSSSNCSDSMTRLYLPVPIEELKKGGGHGEGNLTKKMKNRSDGSILKKSLVTTKVLRVTEAGKGALRLSS